jgi:hypothetical protein
MIGILLALQVNNWNEERKSTLEAKRLLGDLREEIEMALESRREIIQTYQANQDYLASALDKITDNPPGALTVDECRAVSMSHYLRWSPFTLSTLDEMVTSGKISFIRHEGLRNALLDFRNLSVSNREELSQTIMEPNVLVDEFPNLIVRSWNTELQDSEFDCSTKEMNGNKKFLAQLQSNRGRMGGPIYRAQIELEALINIRNKLLEDSQTK